ncbi:hypothetical protein OUZ56_019042 [Daphnia magna]|uniref:BHLH domain-containing protein n=1 Tax=Daphnia magna TaxID=35525 RepID=A0ABQ9ZAH1_9CRUS|nr:hypothetical protein OUZ56_019042 [Daphnia magna]
MTELICVVISTSFDASKSTKGASKLRRDLINTEIGHLRDLLPLPASTRQRLSQLQLMALVCVYVRKANYFQQEFYVTRVSSAESLSGRGCNPTLIRVAPATALLSSCPAKGMMNLAAHCLRQPHFTPLCSF